MQSANIPPTDASTPDRKRRRLGLQVSIETGADGKTPVQQVFSDGSYIPAPDSHFERTSAAATAFVARALAAPTGSASIETTAAESRNQTSRWAIKAVTGIEGALYELGRALAVIESLRTQKPLLELKRIAGRSVRQGEGAASEIAEREGEGMLEMKKRMVTRGAEFLDDRVKALRKWIEADNAFCDAFSTIRKRCNGVRRMPNGTPLIDVGDGDFVPLVRIAEVNPGEEGIDMSGGEESHAAKRPVHVHFPAQTYLKFGLNALDEEYKATSAPVVMESERNMEEKSLTAVIRRVRLSRVSAFRRKTFEQIAKEAAASPSLIELTTNSAGVESGPTDIFRLEKTQRHGSAPSLDAGTDPALPPVESTAELQNASLLQMVATHAYLTQSVSHGSQSPKKVLDRVLAITGSRSVLQATERILDEAVNMLRVRLEWTRGGSRVEEARVRVYSTAADGDGPERALATIEPISNINNGGNEEQNGHVRITPAFGVIIAAPDDPSARGRVVTPHSSSSGGTSSAIGLDDVPRSYLCPVDGEILSVLTLLLCIRLLDALESAARAGVEEVLDVDRQCFTVNVCAPRNGHTLKAKVWPKGLAAGEEVPGSTAWFNGQRIHSFPATGPGRVAAWRQLLRKLVTGDIETVNESSGVKAGLADGVAESVAAKTEPMPTDVQHVQTAAGGIGVNDTAVVGLAAAQRQGTAGSVAGQAIGLPFVQQAAHDAGQFRFPL